MNELNRHIIRSGNAWQGKTISELTKQIETARIATVHRVSALETENDSLKRQLAEAKKRKPVLQPGEAGSDEKDAKAKAEAAARQKEAEEAAVVPNPINEYIELLEEEVCKYPAFVDCQASCTGSCFTPVSHAASLHIPHTTRQIQRPALLEYDSQILCTWYALMS